MITEHGYNLSLEKEAFLHHLIAPAVTHLSQNAYLDRRLGNKRFAQSILDRVRSGFGVKAYPAAAASFKQGIEGGLVPEVAILRNEGEHIGSAGLEKLKKLRNESSPKLDKADLVILRKLLKGKFTDIGRIADTNKYHSKVNDMIEISNLPHKDSLKQILNNYKVSKTNAADLQNLENAWNSEPNKLRELFSNMGDQLSTAPTLNANKHTIADNVGKGVSMATVTGLDPLTGIVNAGKHFLNTDKIRNNWFIRGQKYLTKKLVTDPARASGILGFNGTKFNKLRRKLNVVGVNAATGNANNLINTMGVATSKYKDSPLVGLAKNSDALTGLAKKYMPN